VELLVKLLLKNDDLSISKATGSLIKTYISNLLVTDLLETKSLDNTIWNDKNFINDHYKENWGKLYKVSEINPQWSIPVNNY
jgi:hypothetical protein